MGHRSPLVNAMLKRQHSSLVIDRLLNGVDGDGVAIAYVYCDFSTPNMQSTSAVLGSVLRQVVGALAEIPDEVQKAFERAKKQADGCGLLLPKILDMLIKSLKGLERALSVSMPWMSSLPSTGLNSGTPCSTLSGNAKTLGYSLPAGLRLRRKRRAIFPEKLIWLK